LKSNAEKVSFLRKIFGSGKLSREGSNIAFKCPACNEKKGKFSVNLNTWMCHCWICGVKSKNVYFIIKKYFNAHESSNFIKEFNISLDKNVEEIFESDHVVALPENFKLLSQFSGRDPDIKRCLLYCKSRG
jgi:transcription elongation factor Elf1